MASDDDGADTPSHIDATEATSESVVQVAHLTTHPASKSSSATALERLVLPMPGSPLSRMLWPSESLLDRVETTSSRPWSMAGSGSGPCSLPLREDVFGCRVATSLPA